MLPGGIKSSASSSCLPQALGETKSLVSWLVHFAMRSPQAMKDQARLSFKINIIWSTAFYVCYAQSHQDLCDEDKKGERGVAYDLIIYNQAGPLLGKQDATRAFIEHIPHAMIRVSS